MSSLENRVASLEQTIDGLSSQANQLAIAATGAGLAVDAKTKEQLLLLIDQAILDQEAKDKQIAALQAENARLRYRTEFVVRQLKQELGRE